MLKRMIKWMLLLAVVLSPIVAIAEESIPPGKWWRRPQVAEQLKLNEEKKSRLDELFFNNRLKLIDLKNTVEKERFELGHLLDAEELDEAAIMEQYKKLETARNNLIHERFIFFLEVRKIVGFEGYQRLRDLYQEYRGRRSHRGRDFFDSSE